MSSSSDFRSCALAGTQLNDVDLSDVDKISQCTLETAKGNPLVRHPKTLTRPSSWSAFDPDYVEEDVPF